MTVKALGYTPMIPPWYPQHLPSRFSWHFWVSQGQTQPFVNGAHDAHVSDCQVGTGGGTDGTDGIWLWTHLDRGLGEAGAAGWRRMIVMTHCHMAFIFLHLLYIHMNYKTRNLSLQLRCNPTCWFIYNIYIYILYIYIRSCWEFSLHSPNPESTAEFHRDVSLR